MAGFEGLSNQHPVCNTTQSGCPTIGWRDSGAPLQFDVIIVVMVLFLMFWHWVVHNTYDIPKVKRRKRHWENK